MKKIIHLIHHFFIPEQYREDEVIFRKARILVNSSLITSLFALTYVGVAIFFEMQYAGYMTMLSFVVFLSCAWLLRFGVKYSYCTNLFLLQIYLSTFFLSVYDGGITSATLPWISIAPVAAILFNSARNAWFWAILSVLGVAVIGILDISGYVFIQEINANFVTEFMINSYVGLVLIIFLFAYILESAYEDSLKKLDQKNKEIEKEKGRSDDLLLNILPEEIATELKDNGFAKARQHELVSVMFSDFVNFTSIGEKMTAHELVSELNYFFKKFDEIVTRYRLEKIKTIGDAYLATAGMNIHLEAGAKDILGAALEMQQFVNERKKQREKDDKPAFLMRIGIHTGQVVAGIVGVKKFAYDIWGDTVNTAARMEQSGEPEKVNVSETTYLLIKDDFDCEYRGEIEAKNKGKLKMYFVNNHKLDSALVN